MPRFQEVLNDEPLYKLLENFKFARKIKKDEMGGSAVSKTFWEEKKTGEIWFAKYHLNYAKIKENEEEKNSFQGESSEIELLIVFGHFLLFGG